MDCNDCDGNVNSYCEMYSDIKDYKLKQECMDRYALHRDVYYLRHAPLERSINSQITSYKEKLLSNIAHEKRVSRSQIIREAIDFYLLRKRKITEDQLEA